MSMMTAAFSRAFEIWENRFRLHPEQFMTVEQMAATAVLPLSEQRAACLEAILQAADPAVAPEKAAV